MDKSLVRAFIDTFSNPKGRRVLEYLKKRPSHYIRIDQAPRPGFPNEAFLNPNAALYRAGVDDTIRFIERVLEKRNEVNNDDTGNTNTDNELSEEIINKILEGDAEEDNG